MSNSILQLLLLSASFVSFAIATCYNPDGSAVTNPAFQPCNQIVGAFSMCCGTNWTGAITPDVCEPNGLCLNSYNNGPLYWRGSCTDKTWKSPYCLANLCTKPSDFTDPGSQNVALTQCADGSWCCQGGNTQCCNAKQGVFIPATLGGSISISTSSSSTASIASTTTSDPAASQTSISSTLNTTLDSGGLSSGAKIGLGVGIALGVVLIGAALGWWFWRRRQHYIEAGGPDFRQELEVPKQYVEVPQKEGPLPFQHEVPGDTPPVAELPAYTTARGL